MHVSGTRKRACGLLFPFALLLSKSHRLDGWRESRVDGSDSRRRFWYSRQHIEKQACGKRFFFALPLFTSHGLGGWGERGAGVSLLSSVVLFVFVTAGGKGESAGALFPFGIPPLIFH